MSGARLAVCVAKVAPDTPALAAGARRPARQVANASAACAEVDSVSARAASDAA